MFRPVLKCLTRKTLDQDVQASTPLSALRNEASGVLIYKNRDGRDRMNGGSWFRPGENCWHVEQCDDLSIIVDADDYFTSIREAMKKAESLIIRHR
jgi:hypothetical protein